MRKAGIARWFQLSELRRAQNSYHTTDGKGGMQPLRLRLASTVLFALRRRQSRQRTPICARPHDFTCAGGLRHFALAALARELCERLFDPAQAAEFFGPLARGAQRANASTCGHIEGV